MYNVSPLGRHMILEVWGEPGSLYFWNMDEAAAALVQAAKDAGATVLSERWHHFGSGYGYTGVVILSESHVSVHTWPEKGYAAIDAFYCGKCDPENSLPAILAFYKPIKYEVTFLQRGAPLI
jgi:S-adenosylmethionine decarboxylase